LFFLVLALSLSSVGWNSPSSEDAAKITDYYYYHGQKYFLQHKPDMLYIKLKSIMSKQDFNEMISTYGSTPADYSFERNDIRQIVKLNTVTDAASLNNIVNSIRDNSNVEDASPVFGMKPGTGNDNTLIGCENNIIAQFKPQYNSEQVKQFLTGKGMTIISELQLSGGLSYIISIPKTDNKSSLDQANDVYESGLVNYCDPGLFFTNLLQYIPNDTFFGQQWSARNTGNNIPGGITGTADCDMGLDSAWNQTLGIPQCRISVVDSGIDTTHPDMVSNILHGYNFNYYSNTYGGYDDFGHGASCGGIIGATGNNNQGISGVCPQGKVFEAKIFNAAGSTTNSAIINAMIGVRTFGDSWVSSNSWGGGSPVSAADNAITDGVTLGRNGKGIVFCFATGNNNSSVSWPATHPDVISVGAVSPCNQRKSPSSCDLENWWGSNYGSGLDIVAPGVKIYATVQGGGYTNSFNGTSSATPNCSGVAALMLSKDSNQTWDTVRARINRTALKKGSYSYTSAGPLSNLGNTWNDEMGYGILNANLALLSVLPPSANDVAAGPFLSFPAAFTVNTAYTIRAKISNYGTNGQTNVPVKFFVNSVVTGSTVTIPSLPSGQVDSAAFSWTPAVTGTYSIKIATAMAIDNNRANDTVSAIVTVLPSGVINAQTTICRNGLNILIPSSGSAPRDSITVNIANSYNIVDVNVKIDTVLHTYDGDLEFSLKHLAVTTGIITQIGGAGDNFINTLLNDSATTPIASGTAPFTGSFIPTNPLSSFNGLAVNGSWILGIDDIAEGDSGVLKAWCLQLTYQTLAGGIQTTEIPNYFSLAQNYPNPFNPTTVIEFSIPTTELVMLKVFDVLGREVAVLVNELKRPGFHSVDFNAANLASGIYFYRIDAGEFTSVKRMMLIK
jgi:subtilisin-like proprotein convertase family protein